MCLMRWNTRVYFTCQIISILRSRGMAVLTIDPLDERVRGHFISNKFYEAPRR